jgi:UDP-glucuronate decarboxylase
VQTTKTSVHGAINMLGLAKRLRAKILQVGNPKEFTISELASLVIELTGSRSRIAHRPRPQDDPRQRRPDISKANDLLAWAPKIELKEGLSRTIKYFEDLLSDATVKASIASDQSAEA